MEYELPIKNKLLPQKLFDPFYSEFSFTTNHSKSHPLEIGQCVSQSSNNRVMDSEGDSSFMAAGQDNNISLNGTQGDHLQYIPSAPRGQAESVP